MYRSDDEAARARALAAFERKQAAGAALREIEGDRTGGSAPNDDVLDLDRPDVDLTAIAEALERDAMRLESELRARHRAPHSIPPRVENVEPTAGPTLGAALARHVSVGRRLRTIAPLVHAARAARGLGPIEAGSLLGRRPGRGTDDAIAIAELTRACDDAESALDRLGLTDASGKSADRARDAALLSGTVASIPRPAPELLELANALARYEAAAKALGAPGMVARGAQASMGELPALSFASRASTKQSLSNVQRETARCESAIGALARASVPVRVGASAPALRVSEDVPMHSPLFVAWLVIVATLGGSIALIASGNFIFVGILGFIASRVWKRFVSPSRRAPEVRVQGKPELADEGEREEDDEASARRLGR